MKKIALITLSLLLIGGGCTSAPADTTPAEPEKPMAAETAPAEEVPTEMTYQNPAFGIKFEYPPEMTIDLEQAGPTSGRMQLTLRLVSDDRELDEDGVQTAGTAASLTSIVNYHLPTTQFKADHYYYFTVDENGKLTLTNDSGEETTDYDGTIFFAVGQGPNGIIHQIIVNSHDAEYGEALFNQIIESAVITQ